MLSEEGHHVVVSSRSGSIGRRPTRRVFGIDVDTRADGYSHGLEGHRLRLSRGRLVEAPPQTSVAHPHRSHEQGYSALLLNPKRFAISGRVADFVDDQRVGAALQ